MRAEVTHRTDGHADALKNLLELHEEVVERGALTVARLLHTALVAQHHDAPRLERLGLVQVHATLHHHTPSYTQHHNPAHW